MSLKLLLRLSLLAAVAAGIGLAGCSDDTNRTSVTGSDDLVGQLATGVEDPMDLNDYYDHISDGYYYPDGATEDENTLDPYEPDPDDDPSHKPIDNGGGVE
jgi:hypothetical protein